MTLIVEIKPNHIIQERITENKKLLRLAELFQSMYRTQARRHGIFV